MTFPEKISKPIIPVSYPSPIEETEKKISKDSFIKNKLFTKDLSDDQITFRDGILQRKTTLHPNPKMHHSTESFQFPLITFSSQDLHIFLTDRLQKAEFLEQGPFLIGGAAAAVLLYPKKGFEFADIDLCYYLRVNAYDEIKHLLIDFIKERLTLSSGEEKKQSFDFQKTPPTNRVIEHTYFYRKAYLTDSLSRLGGTFFGFGNIEVKFFYENICRQNIAISDGFRIPFSGKETFCLNISSPCEEIEFVFALDALKRRIFTVKNPSEVKELILRAAHKVTNGFKITQPEIISEALEKFQKTYILSDTEFLGPKLHRHLDNHYGDNKIAKFLDFINLLNLIDEAKSHKCKNILYQEIASSWLNNAAKDAKKSLLGRLASLIQNDPKNTSHYIYLIQGLFLHQWYQENPTIKGYYFDFDPKELRLQFSLTRQNAEHFLSIKSTPETLCVNFLDSWQHLERSETKAKILQKIFDKLGFKSLTFSKKCRIQIAEQILDSFDTKSDFGSEKLNWRPFYQFLLINNILPHKKNFIERLMLEDTLNIYLKESSYFKSEKIHHLISLVLQSLKRFSFEKIRQIHILLKDFKLESEIHCSLKMALGNGFFLIIQHFAISTDLESLPEAQSLASLTMKMQFFSPVAISLLQKLFLTSYEKLIDEREADALIIISKCLQEFNEWMGKSEEVEKISRYLSDRLSDKLFVVLRKIEKTLSELPNTDDLSIAFNCIEALQPLLLNELKTRYLYKVSSKFLNYSLTSKDPNVLMSAGKIEVTIIKKLAEKHPDKLSSLVLVDKLFSIQKKYCKKETPIENFRALANTLLSLLENCDKSQEWQKAIQEMLLKKIIDTLFGATLINFEKSINNRQELLKILVWAFNSLEHVKKNMKEESLFFEKFALSDLRSEHKKIRNAFLEIIIQINPSLGNKILMNAPKELLSEEERWKHGNLLIQKQILTSLNLAYETWKSITKSSKKISADTATLQISSSILLLNALINSENREIREKFIFLTNDLISIINANKKYHEVWRKESPDDFLTLQNEITHFLLKFSTHRSEISLTLMENLFSAAHHSGIFSTLNAGLLFLRFIENCQTIKNIPSPLFIKYYLNILYSDILSEIVCKKTLMSQMKLLIQACYEKKQIEYQLLGIKAFQHILEAPNFTDIESYVNLLNIIPLHLKESLEYGAEIEHLFNTFLDKKIYNELVAEQKIIFIKELLVSNVTSLYPWVFKEIHKFPMYSKDAPDELLKLNRLFCSRAVKARNSELIFLSAEKINLFEFDSLSCEYLCEGISHFSNKVFFDRLDKRIFVNQRCYRYYLKYLINLYKAIEKTEKKEDLSMLLVNIKAHWKTLVSFPELDNDFDMANNEIISFFSYLKDNDHFILACQIFCIKTPIDPISSLSQLFSVFFNIPSEKYQPYMLYELNNVLEIVFENTLIPILDIKSHIILKQLLEFSLHTFGIYSETALKTLTAFLELEIEKKKQIEIKPEIDKKAEKSCCKILTKFLKICSDKGNLKPLKKAIFFAREFLSKKSEHIISEQTKEILLSHQKAILELPITSGTMDERIQIKKSYRVIKDLLYFWSDFQPQMGRELLIHWSNKALTTSNDFCTEVDDAITVAWKHNLFKNTSTEWGKIVPLKGKSKLAIQSQMHDLELIVIRAACECKSKDVISLAKKRMKSALNFSKKNDEKEIKELISSFLTLHAKSVVQLAIYQDEANYRDFISLFMDFLKRDFPERLHKWMCDLFVLQLLRILLFPTLHKAIINKVNEIRGEKSFEDTLKGSLNSSSKILELASFPELDIEMNLIEDAIKFAAEIILYLSTEERLLPLQPKNQECMFHMFLEFFQQSPNLKILTQCQLNIFEMYIDTIQLVKNFSCIFLPKEFLEQFSKIFNTTFSNLITVVKYKNVYMEELVTKKANGIIFLKK